METKELPDHWDFALVAALGHLKYLVWGFDFDRDVNGHNLVGYPEPDELIPVIDGFLSEQSLFYGGDIANLKRMRETLEEELKPIFETGKKSAHDFWSSVSLDSRGLYADYDAPDFQQEAKNRVPENTSYAGTSWFIEGFCRQWQDEFMSYVRETMLED